STDSSAELVLPGWGLCRRKEPSRIHLFVAEKLEGAPVHGVGAALQRKTGHPRERVTVLGRVIVADELKLRDGIHRRIILAVVLRAGSTQHAPIVIDRVGK